MWILDSSVYFRAFTNARFGDGLTRFHAAHLPRIILSAVVVSELLVGCRNAHAERRLREGLLEPFERRGRIHVPTRSTWELAARLDRQLRGRRAGARLDQRAFANDLLIAASARELGATIICGDEENFSLIARVLDFGYAPPWP